MTEAPKAGQLPPEQQPAATFQIEKIYVKDLSLELPNAPQIFLQAESPQLEIQVRNEGQKFADALYEVVVTVTVTARVGEKTLFLDPLDEAWMGEAIEKHNVAVRGYNHDDEMRKGILGACGMTDDASAPKDAVNLNNLDDWYEFHQAVLKG